MLITKFVVPQDELVDIGLKPIEMNRLGQFIALTGKNGAGKSRILNKLFYYINQRNNLLDGMPHLEQNVQVWIHTIQASPPDHPDRPSWQSNLDNSLKHLDLVKSRLWTSKHKIGALRFVPKQLNLADPRQNHKAALDAHYRQTMNPGLEAFEHLCFSYIQAVQNRKWEATHPDATHTQADIQTAKAEYSNLCSTIELLLKTTLGRSIDADATLFGKPLAESGLSDGQKILVQLVVALHAQKGRLDNTVFLLDEPENHLHPSALIEFLDALSEVASNSQFWIATHSVPLLAHIAKKEPMSIWYVEDGQVTNSGSKPEKVLRGLLGNDEQIDNLNEFTSLPAQFAAVNFSAECLIAPKSISHSSGDHQVAQIADAIGASQQLPVSILDYGAGKSRILSGLNELISAGGRITKDCINYYAFDTSTTDRPDSQSVIEQVFGKNLNRHFLTHEDFFSIKDDACIDVVVMCNVLHEIQPNDWLKLFHEQSLIYRSLKEDGYLLLVEDQRIPVGEKPHQYGFMVLDTAHLKTLFSITENDMDNGMFQIHDYRGDGRLKAHKISKTLLNRITADTRRRAIIELGETAKNQIHALRRAEPNYRNGQLHAFWTQQFANTALWLDEQ